MASAIADVEIKKEIVDSPETLEQVDTQETLQNQNEQSSQKSSKIWCEEETRSLIALAKHYVPKCKDPSYTKKQLLEDIAKELHLIGYDATPDNIRNKMKYLRTRYKNVIDYNAKHVEKRTMPFSEELAELYGMEQFEDQDMLNVTEVNGNGDSNTHYKSPRNTRPSKRVSKSVPASHVDLESVVTSKKRNSSPQKKTVVKKKATGKNRAQPLFQCGLCMEKFSTSFDMHGHNCRPAAKVSETNKKKVNHSSTSATSVFHWNSLITMHFLELLREYQLSSKNSSFRKGNIWENLSLLMKRRGHTVQPKELEKKFSVLTSAFEKTMKYNKTHKDKKKCAFFKRLTELHRHPQSFSCFKSDEHVKMTVEVSPFSFSKDRDPSYPISSRSSAANSNNHRKNVETKPPHTPNGSSEVLQWLQSSWNEWKEMEKKKEETMARRHNELMEMLSYLIDSSGDNTRG